MPTKLPIWVAAVAAASACIESPPEPEPDTGTSSAALAGAGMERLIPIRITAFRDCMPGPCADLLSLADINASIEVTNRIFAPAGVQFYLERLDRPEAPIMELTWYSGSPQMWANVKEELHDVFPQMPLDAYADDTWKETGMWMHAVQAIFEDNRRLHIWVTSEPGSSRSSAAIPQSGRGIRMLPGHFAGNKRYVMAHEIGHFLGLPHTFEYRGDMLDPETLQPWKRSDRWDLMFKRGTGPANPHTYFSSRAAAAAVEGSLELIELPLNDGDEDKDTVCDTDYDTVDFPGYPLGTVRCAVGIDQAYWEWKYTGDDALKGLAREYPDGSRGKNIMAYKNGPAGNALPGFLSESQIAIIKKNLRWDIPYDTDSQNDYLDGFQGTPTNMGGRRPRLGSARAAEPAPGKMDFDGDGKRDIAYWIAPMTPFGTGEFRVLLSSHNFAGTNGLYLHVSLGRAGDIAVPADYNGDGITDVAVYQAGGGLNRDQPESTSSWWRYCATDAANAIATTCAVADGTPIQFGSRQDTPQFGHDFDGVAGDELAIYRAETGRFYVRNASNSWSFNRALGVAKGGVVPLVGQYGCDNAADLAVYEPSTARFKLLDSVDDWEATVTQQFDTEMIPLPSGAGEDRAAPIALSGMVSRKACSIGGTLIYRSRRAAALWYPPAGQWNIVWNPTTAAAPIDQCGYGNGATDLPLAGVDRNSDGRSDLALLRPATTWGGNGSIFTRHSVAGACNGTSATTRTCTDCGASTRAWATPDVTGDSLGDIQTYDGNAARLRRYRSQDDFAASSSHTLAGITAQML